MQISDNDILALTLSNPTHLDPFEFVFPGGVGFVVDTGIFRFEPMSTRLSNDPVSLVLSVGIHGNETGPIELVNQLVKNILSGKLSLAIRLLVVIGNPVSANQATRFCEVNLNRLFNGAWQQYLTNEEGLGSSEARRAERLEKAVSDFYAQDSHCTLRLHYDLHTAIRGSKYEKFAVHPFMEEPVYQHAQFGFLVASGIEAVLLSHQPTTTFSYYSYAAHRANSFTIELGKVHPFGENDLSSFTQIQKALIILLENATLAQGDLSSIQVFAVQDALVKNADDYQLTIAEDEENFTDFEEGYELVTSSADGYRITKTGDAIVFPNAKVPIGQRAGLVVRPIAINSLAFELTS